MKFKYTTELVVRDELDEAVKAVVYKEYCANVQAFFEQKLKDMESEIWAGTSTLTTNEPLTPETLENTIHSLLSLERQEESKNFLTSLDLLRLYPLTMISAPMISTDAT